MLYLAAGALCALAALLPRTVRVNIVVLVAIVAALEVVAAIAIAGRPRDKVVTLSPETRGPAARRHIQPDENLGYRLVPDSHVLIRHTSDEAVIYESSVSVDALGRRKTPRSPRGEANAFVAFFGDSFTFGEGVNDDQTFAAYTAVLLPEFAVYNYGVSGYGVQHVNVLMESRNLRSEVGEGRGVAVYTYLDAHVHRAALTSRSGTSRRSPYYVLDENGNLVRRGNFHTTQRLLYTLYEEVLPRSNLYAMFRLDIPPVGSAEIMLTCRLVVAAKERFLRQFADSAFIVAMFPRRGDRYGPQMKDCLEANRVTVWDHSREPWPSELLIPHDGHPSARGHLKFAQMLAPQLREAIAETSR